MDQKALNISRNTNHKPFISSVLVLTFRFKVFLRVLTFSCCENMAETQNNFMLSIFPTLKNLRLFMPTPERHFSDLILGASYIPLRNFYHKTENIQKSLKSTPLPSKPASISPNCSNNLTKSTMTMRTAIISSPSKFMVSQVMVR